MDELTHTNYPQAGLISHSSRERAGNPEPAAQLLGRYFFASIVNTGNCISKIVPKGQQGFQEADTYSNNTGIEHGHILQIAFVM